MIGLSGPALTRLLVWRLWQKTCKQAVDICRAWSRCRLGGLAAEIAFFAVLSVFPTLIMLASVLGSLDAMIGQDTAASIKEWVGTWIVEVFGARSALKEISDDLFDQSRSGLVTVAMMSSLYLASRGFTAAVRSLEVVYGSKRRRGWLSARITGMTLTVVTLVVVSLAAAALAVNPLLGVADKLTEQVGAGWALARTWAWLRWPALSVMIIAWVTAIYHIVPRHRCLWRAELPGAVLCAVWWLSVSLGFQTYLGVALGGVNAVFGILGGALSLLVWLYLMAMGFLVGAALNSVRQRRLGRPGVIAMMLTALAGQHQKPLGPEEFSDPEQPPDLEELPNPEELLDLDHTGSFQS